MASLGKKFGPWVVGRPDIVPFRRQRSSAGTRGFEHRPDNQMNCKLLPS